MELITFSTKEFIKHVQDIVNNEEPNLNFKINNFYNNIVDYLNRQKIIINNFDYKKNWIGAGKYKDNVLIFKLDFTYENNGNKYNDKFIYDILQKNNIFINIGSCNSVCENNLTKVIGRSFALLCKDWPELTINTIDFLYHQSFNNTTYDLNEIFTSKEFDHIDFEQPIFEKILNEYQNQYNYPDLINKFNIKKEYQILKKQLLKFNNNNNILKKNKI